MSLLGKRKGRSGHRHLREGGDPLLLWIPAFEAVAKALVPMLLTH